MLAHPGPAVVFIPLAPDTSTAVPPVMTGVMGTAVFVHVKEMYGRSARHKIC